MPRKARDERLGTRAERLRLPVRREPYWRNIQEGRAIGYRRAAGGKAGTWIARFYDPSGERLRKYHAISTADDLLDADGVATQTFAQAQEAAREWFTTVTRQQGRVIEVLTVKQAMTSYVEDYSARGGKDVKGLQGTIDAHVLPKLGNRNVAELTTASIRAWHRALATAAPRVRSKIKATKPATRPVGENDADGQRARRSSANRILTVLKAALNLAFADGRVGTDEAWRRVLPFKAVDAARVRFLTDEEAVSLVKAAKLDFQPMIKAALLTGARWGELVRFKVQDFNPEAGTLHVRVSKSGKARHVMLTDEGTRFFKDQCEGKNSKATILPRPGGDEWAKSEQHRPMQAACKGAEITPAIGFHILRHTHASRLTMAGVPLGVVAAQLGNGEGICSKHYAHLSPGYVADSIRAAFKPLGIVSTANVEQLSGA